MGLVADYPFWFVLLCLILGALYAFLLYFRDRKRSVEPWLKLVMAALRFASISLISFLLLSPLIRRTFETIEKPLVIIGLDNSASVTMSKDSVLAGKVLKPELELLAGKLQQKYDVKTFSIGDACVPGLAGTFDQKRTDLSAFFNDILNLYSGNNVGAVILVSDGIFNKGTDPVYSARNLRVPVFTVPLGDTALRKDIIARKVLVNKTVFKGDRFPAEILLEMNGCSGSTATVGVSMKGQTVFNREIKITGNKMISRVPVMLDAKETGIQHYTVTVTPVAGEAALLNNRLDFFVEVMDSRQKVAILYNAPHPDIAAIRQALERTERYDVSLFTTGTPAITPAAFDLVVLYQLPSVGGSPDPRMVLKSATPVLFVLGSQTDMNAFNSLNPGLTVSSSKQVFSESQPAYNDAFTLFLLDKEELATYRDFPPLMSPFGVYQYGPLSNTLFFQKMGNIQTKSPLVMFVNQPGKKSGFIAGENFWRWRIADYTRNSSTEVFNALMSKIVQYLSVKEDRSFFRVRVSQKINEDEPVEFVAELFNASYEPVTTSDVDLIITDQDKKVFPFSFNKSNNQYILNAGVFPPGTYTYQATAKLGQEQYRRTGSFIVAPVNVESIDLVADHRMLHRLAAEHGGAMILPGELATLADLLEAREDIHSVSVVQKRYTDLVGNPWIFLIILTLITAEWVLRRRNGL